jgi:hypothetical protein
MRSLAEPDKPAPLPLDLKAGEVKAEPGEYCPTCGAKLKERGCKLKCEQCGFFLSCSDFY